MPFSQPRKRDYFPGKILFCLKISIGGELTIKLPYFFNGTNGYFYQRLFFESLSPISFFFILRKKKKKQNKFIHDLGKGGDAHEKKKKQTCFNQLSRENLLLANKVSRSVGGQAAEAVGEGGWVSRGFPGCTGGGLRCTVAELVLVPAIFDISLWPCLLYN